MQTDFLEGQIIGPLNKGKKGGGRIFSGSLDRFWLWEYIANTNNRFCFRVFTLQETFDLVNTTCYVHNKSHKVADNILWRPCSKFIRVVSSNFIYNWQQFDVTNFAKIFNFSEALTFTNLSQGILGAFRLYPIWSRSDLDVGIKTVV